MQTNSSHVPTEQVSEVSTNQNNSSITEQAQNSSNTVQDRRQLVQNIHALGDCV